VENTVYTVQPITDILCDRWEVAGPPGQAKILDIGQDIALQDRQKDEMLRHLATLGRFYPLGKIHAK
jgi:hypothetical protein